LPGQLGGLKANINPKTIKAMATKCLGGTLVCAYAVLTAMFGGKYRA
jgi:hypothetical protein